MKITPEDLVIARKDHGVYPPVSAEGESAIQHISRCRHDIEWWKRKIHLQSNGETKRVDIRREAPPPSLKWHQASSFQPSPWQSSSSYSPVTA